MDDKAANIVFDQWLTEFFKLDVYRIMVNDNFIKLFNKKNRKASDVCNEFIALQNKPVFMYSKVHTMYFGGIKFLEDFGFNLIDTNVTFEKPISIRANFIGNCSLRFATPDDQNHVVRLASKSFIFTRFHMDPAISNKTANRVKGEWFNNYFAGNRGDQLVVALIDGKIVGTLQIIYGVDKTLIIDQIATNKEYRRMGIAKDMIAFAENNCRGFNRIRVGTQIANIPSINLYEGIGFRISDAQYVFHYHQS